MEFYRTKSTLEAFKERDQIYAEEMAGLFLDICRDIREETGMAAAKLPVGEPEKFALRLSQMGEMYRYLLKEQEAVLQDTQRRKTLAELRQETEIMVSRTKEKKKEMEELARYQSRMSDAWSAAARDVGIGKEADERREIEREIELQKEQTEQAVEAYRKKIEAVIHRLEQAWEP